MNKVQTLFALLAVACQLLAQNSIRIDTKTSLGKVSPGIFGYLHTLTLRYQGGLLASPFRIYAQDLASDETPTAIPYTITSDGQGIILQGADLEALCKGHDYPYSEVQREANKDYTDQSDPAVVLLVVDSPTVQKPPA